ncbi:VOC family protein [Culicoidibacter larvae]|uniref:VOC domain-containing protein n=1 Tax=Culicoidibacter larvae TaxID=2579976 RepID=A0A5R8QFF3_9FIRM|nr:VOC family protein [Culicoidibacter larvae]TLG75389.1 hypothetical protein FEZ08_04895 [Culicoidibacter larvae]
MINQIFVNLPVNDLDASKAFWSGLGFKFNPTFTDENGACLILGDTIFVMLLTKPFFESFTQKPTADPSVVVEAINALQVESREAVDKIVANGATHGVEFGRRPEDPEWMYSRTFKDPDGHNWELFYMNESEMTEE